MNKTGVIYGINGPVVYLKGNTGFKMSEMVYVGKERLVGEVIALTKDTTTVQVFEETTGLKPGETVTASGDALSVTLGPGILNNIFDGIERPLSEIAKQSGKYISRGLTVDSLDTEKKWDVHVTVSEGEELMGGAIIAETQETRSIVHKSMVPPDVNGTVIWAAKDGKYTILDHCKTETGRRHRKRDHTGTEMADPCTASNPEKISGIRSADHRTAYPGYDVPDRKRRHSSHPWRIRYRKNHDPAPDRKMV